LRAAKVRAVVHARDAGAYRHLFRTLKFLRLLPVIRPAEQNGHPGYELELDGPFSLFQGGTRYGLQLGLALPAIAACDHWAIDADVLWGAARTPLRFRLAGEAASVGRNHPPDALGRADPGLRRGDEAAFPDELATFTTAFARLESGWQVDPSPAVLDLPGAGLCVPDLAFVAGKGR